MKPKLKNPRVKISTTISATTYEYLLTREDEESLGRVIDAVVAKLLLPKSVLIPKAEN
jgi:hypothetical protein